VVAHHRLEDVLVHAQRRGEHAGTHVGNAGELEQPLHRAVLAERPVQDREDDVDLRELRRHVAGRQPLEAGGRCVFSGAGIEGGPGRRELPAARPVDLDGHDLVAARLERRRDALRGGDRDLVLAGAAAEDDGDPPAHGGVVV